MNWATRRAGMAALLAGLSLASAGQARAQPSAGLYGRIEKRLGDAPALAAALGKPAPEMDQVAWMVGEWDIEWAVTGRDGRSTQNGRSRISPLYDGVWLELRDTYPDRNQDLSYLGFNPATGRWTSAAIDKYGDANVVTSGGWVGDRLVFEGDFVVLGLVARLRQTIRRLGPDAFRVENEERVDEAWRPVDAYTYRRRPADAPPR